MDFHPFVSSSKDFTFDFSMSHCYARYRSEEISPPDKSTTIKLWLIKKITLRLQFNVTNISALIEETITKSPNYQITSKRTTTSLSKKFEADGVKI